jgi:hypothetical protein
VIAQTVGKSVYLHLMYSYMMVDIDLLYDLLTRYYKTDYVIIQ